MVIEISRKRLILFVALLIALIAVPLTVWLSLQRQDTRSRADIVPDTTVVATFNGDQITKGDLREVAEEQYLPDSVTDNALKDALNILLERRILDFSAQESEISVTNAEANSFARSSGLSRTEAYYELLKERIIFEQVKAVKAVSIGFWAPPSGDRSIYTSEELSNIDAQLRVRSQFLADAESGLEGDQDPYDLAEDLLAEYEVLNKSLALNGHIVSSIPGGEGALYSVPAVYEYAGSNLDSETRNQIFSESVQPGDVVVASNTSANSGGSAFKIVEIGQGSAESYDSWLASQKNSLVTIVTQL